MASNGASPRVEDTENSLEKIKRQLASASGRNLLQGPLLKRSETLRKWNERWVILDPTTGKMEYKIRRNEPNIKGTIVFDANSTIALSPVNFHGLPKYDGCCIYIGTPQKKDYFLCAESPGAAKAWVSTLQPMMIHVNSRAMMISLSCVNYTAPSLFFLTHKLTFLDKSATQLVLRAHKDAVNSLSGSGSSQLGTVATVVGAANSAALEATKEIEAAMKISLRNALGSVLNKSPDGQIDNTTIMKETLRVKDEELQNLARELRAREYTIKELVEKLSETAEAAQAAASSAHTMDEQRRVAYVEMERLKESYEKQLQSTTAKLRESEEKAVAQSGEIEQLIKQRDSAVQEAHLWRTELAKARDHAVISQAAVVRAEEKIRITEAEAEVRIKEAEQKTSAALHEKQELLKYVNALQAQLQRQQIGAKQVFEKTESCSDIDNTCPLTKHVDSSDENVDKACLSVSNEVPVTEDSVAHLSGLDQSRVHPAVDRQWNDIQATESRIADVREVALEGEGSSLDIPVVSSAVSNSQHEQ